ncbi:hypothetical protein BDQ17DRAFT_1438653 [Cyathus striatus]|nr:hypothetical protein BDQ17DRAFT_1438653 [Cyathus striatus]
MPSRNSKKTNAPVSPPTSHSGLVHTEPPVSRGCKRTQSTVDTTAEPATKKPAITADEEAADNSAKQEREMVEREEVGKRGGEVGIKLLVTKIRKTKLQVMQLIKINPRHNAMKKLQEMAISIAPPVQLKTAGASGTTEASETIGASETTRISEITRASEITSTSEVLATTPSESSESEDNNLEAEHGSGTENVSQDSNEEDEDKDGSDNVDVDNDDDDEGEEGKR